MYAKSEIGRVNVLLKGGKDFFYLILSNFIKLQVSVNVRLAVSVHVSGESLSRANVWQCQNAHTTAIKRGNESVVT